MSITEILQEPISSKKRKHEENCNDKSEPDRKRHKNLSFDLCENSKFKLRIKKLISDESNKRETFKSIGVCRELCIATKKIKWLSPTIIQSECIPQILLGRDVIALAQTGSGKTGSFAIPIIQSLLNKPISYHSLIISPTRELSLQIHTEFENLGSDLGLKCLTIIGGIDRLQQQLKLQKKPHCIIGTPGRILDHLITCKGFKLHNLKYLVLDEADRILQSEFAKSIQQIIKIIQTQKKEYQLKLLNDDESKINPHNYQTLLFSATMTKKVERLEKASLRTSNMIKIESNSKYKTVSTLDQFYLFIPAKHKLFYITYLLNNIFNDRSIIVFTNTKKSCHHLSLVLHNLNLTVIPLHGEMSQYERMGAIEKFKNGLKSILIATDVAARGLDIPIVTIIINYDIPIHSKDYIHRVGRTARNGKYGKAINIITQYDVEIFQRIEELINIKMNKYPNIDKNNVLQLSQRVIKADHIAQIQIKQHRDEIKDKIKELNKRKNNNNDNSFIIDDIDYDRNKNKQISFNKKRKRGKKGNKGNKGRRAQSFDSMKDYKKSWKF